MAVKVEDMSEEEMRKLGDAKPTLVPSRVAPVRIGYGDASALDASVAPVQRSILEIHEISGGKYGMRLSWEGDRPSWIDVRVAEACDCYSGDVHSIMYAEKGVPHNNPQTEDFEKAQRLFGLALKFDQCAHWYFGEEEEGRNGDGYIHTCGDGLEMLAVMRFAYDRAKKIMVDNGNWFE